MIHSTMKRRLGSRRRVNLLSGQGYVSEMTASCHVFAMKTMINILNLIYQLNLMGKTLVWYFCTWSFTVVLFRDFFCCCCVVIAFFCLNLSTAQAAVAVSPRAWESRYRKVARMRRSFRLLLEGNDWRFQCSLLQHRNINRRILLIRHSVWILLWKRIWRFKTVSWSGRLCDQSVWVWSCFIFACVSKLERAA